MTTHKLRWLNVNNATITGEVQLRYVEQVLIQFPKEKLTLLEIGSAYGGGVEMMAKIINMRGKVYGYDTFEGHPRDLSDDPKSDEATCMDMWYNNAEFGRDKLSYDYQRKVLDEQGLDNAILVKGRINKHSWDDIEKIHLAMIDLDLLASTKIAYNGIKDKVVKKGYLFMHDTRPDCLPLIHKYLHEVILEDKRWMIELELPQGYVTVLKRL